MQHAHVEKVQEQDMQDGARADEGYGKRISGATGKDDEHGSSGGGYKNRRSKKGMTIPINPE